MADAEFHDFLLPDVESHRFEPLADGQSQIDALIRLIDSTQSSVQLVYYIFANDEAGLRVRDALVEAAKRQVAVTLLIDGFGSGRTDDGFLQPLTDVGGEVRRYAPKRSRRYLLRNHQKIAVADQSTAIIGGFNVRNDYFANHGDSCWRDFGLWIEGTVAGKLADFCSDLWEWTSRKRGKMRDLRDMLLRHSEQDGDVRLLLGGPTRELSPWALALNNDLAGASEADMAAAYFAPYGGVLRKTRMVAKRGRARLLTASKSDNTVTIAAARNRYQYLLPETSIFEFSPCRLHTKLFVIDEAVYVGSANLDVRSLYLNLEIMVRIRDADFARRMRRYIGEQCAEAHEITVEDYADMNGWWARVKGRLSYFLMSALDYNISRRLNFGSDRD